MPAPTARRSRQSPASPARRNNSPTRRRDPPGTPTPSPCPGSPPRTQTGRPATPPGSEPSRKTNCSGGTCNRPGTTPTKTQANLRRPTPQTSPPAAGKEARPRPPPRPARQHPPQPSKTATTREHTKPPPRSTCATPTHASAKPAHARHRDPRRAAWLRNLNACRRDGRNLGACQRGRS